MILYAKAAGGNWSAAGTWSNASSAGTDSSGPPTETDDVVLDSGSGNVTVDAVSYCKSLDCASGSNYAGTLTVNFSGLYFYGNTTTGRFFRLSSAMTVTLQYGHEYWYFEHDGSSQLTIITAGKTIGSLFSGGNTSNHSDLILGDALTCYEIDAYTFSRFDTGGFNVNLLSYFPIGVGSLTRVLNLNNSIIDFISSTGQLAAFTTTGLTFNAGTSEIRFTGSGTGLKQFNGAAAGLTYNNVTFAGDNTRILGGNTFNRLALNNAGFETGLKLPAGLTQTVTEFTNNGTAGNLTKLLSNTSGSQHTLSKSSGIVSCDYMSIKDSNATGGATWYAGANSVDEGGNSGWIFGAAPSTGPSAGQRVIMVA